MSTTLSIRQQIISAWADALRAGGQFRLVEDAEPYNYATAPLPACWIVEGDESVDFGQLTTKAICDLTVIVQVVFAYNSAVPAQSLYRIGRAHLAGLQQTVLTHHQWSNLALLTLEQGNAIGKLDSDTHALGVLTTQWLVRYRRAFSDPAAQ